MFSFIDHIMLIVNPFDQPVFPRSLQSIDTTISSSSEEVSSDYHRLHFPLVHDQNIKLNSFVSTPIPTRRCYVPILSFVTNSNSFDIPIPLLCDWIVASAGSIPGCHDLCEAIREPLIAFNKNPLSASFSNRRNRVFFRGNLSSLRRCENEE